MDKIIVTDFQHQFNDFGQSTECPSIDDIFSHAKSGCLEAVVSATPYLLLTESINPSAVGAICVGGSTVSIYHDINLMEENGCFGSSTQLSIDFQNIYEWEEAERRNYSC